MTKILALLVRCNAIQQQLKTKNYKHMESSKIIYVQIFNVHKSYNIYRIFILIVVFP